MAFGGHNDWLIQNIARLVLISAVYFSVKVSLRCSVAILTIEHCWVQRSDDIHIQLVFVNAPLAYIHFCEQVHWAL